MNVQINIRFYRKSLGGGEMKNLNIFISLFASAVILLVSCERNSLYNDSRNSGFQGDRGSDDYIAPVAWGGGNITFSRIKTNSLMLNWEPASDNKTAVEYLRYRVFYASTGNIGSLADIQ